MRVDVGIPINQCGRPHGEVTLGKGPRTIAQSGCMLSCFAMVARALTSNRGLSVLEAQARILARNGFVGSGLKRNVAANALGIMLVDADGHERFDMHVIAEEIAAGRPVIVGVDYKDGRSSGMSDADHFLVVVDADEVLLRCADPSSGALVVMCPDDLVYRRAPARMPEMIRFRPMPL